MRRKIVKALKRLYWDLFSLLSSNSIQKRLGYPRKTKLLIIHADDMGMSASENAASIMSMENGFVNSGSIMVPCPGFQEMASYLCKNRKADVGVHLTLTSEWPSYRWKPVMNADEVPSIVDQDGNLYSRKDLFFKHANPDDVEKECRAQIMRAIESGIELTHIDSHMFFVFNSEKILRKVISLGEKFNLPVLLTHELPSWVREKNGGVIVDRLICAKQEDFNKGLNDFYRKTLKSLKPGLNCLLVHVAFNDREMQLITGEQNNFGSFWRQADYDFFTSEECGRLLTENKIQLITWRELKEKSAIS